MLLALVSGSMTESLGLYDFLCLSSWRRMAAVTPHSICTFKAGEEGKGRCQPHIFLFIKKTKVLPKAFSRLLLTSFYHMVTSRFRKGGWESQLIRFSIPYST